MKESTAPPTTSPINLLNDAARECFDFMAWEADRIRAKTHSIGGGSVLDVGVETSGSLAAGLGLARLCLGDAAEVSLTPTSADSLVDWDVCVRTDHPVVACLGGQYAGWPVSVGPFFAMGSGPMRMRRGREEMLEHLGLLAPADADSVAVGVLESGVLPDEDVVNSVADQCGVDASRLFLAIAPSTSIAGSVQVVARSIETALHKLHALKFDVSSVVSATGIAPLPPPARPGDTIDGIGRTNDAMLYGARVTMYVDADDDAIDAVASQVPSDASSDHGRPFKAIFKDYDHDFYKVDPMLFSPAVVTISNLRSGRTWRHGQCLPNVLRESFGL